MAINSSSADAQAPFATTAPLEFDGKIPDAVDVVVVGAGVIGISTAWYLRQAGLSVLVCDKGRVAAEQSSRNWGWVRVTARDPDEVPIAIDSIRCWEDIAQSLNEDIGFTRQGVLALAQSQAEMRQFEAWRTFAKAHEVETKLFSQSEISAHINVPAQGWQGGMITPSDARAEPFKAVPAIARGLHARGGTIREACAVRTIDVEAGRVTGVATESGRVRAGAVVCALGAWTSLFLSNLNITLPQLAVRGTVVKTTSAPEVFPGAAALGDVFIRRRQDGGYTVASGFTEHVLGANSFRFMRPFMPARGTASDIVIRTGHDATQQSIRKTRWSADETSPFEAHRMLSPAASERALKKIRRNFDRRIPALAGTKFAQSWSGMIDVTPDVVPVMDAIAGLPGLFVATGFSGHGFGIGPGAGRAMARLVLNQSPEHDLSRFRFERFSDGSKIRPGPSI